MSSDLTASCAVFVGAICIGDEQTARAVVEQLRAAGASPEQIYFQLFAPAMVMIGELWERNELSVADEHLATAITERLIGQVSPDFGWPSGQPLPGTVVLGCVAGERHVLGLRMLADLFRQSGWQVLYLGADVPTDDWVRLVQRYLPTAVAISVGAERYLPVLHQLVQALQAVAPNLLIQLGGAACSRDPALPARLGAVCSSPDPVVAVADLTARALDLARGTLVQ